jgi:hypothetical protein
MQLSRERQFIELYCLVAIEELLLKKINRREFVATTAAPARGYCGLARKE